MRQSYLERWSPVVLAALTCSCASPVQRTRPQPGARAKQEPPGELTAAAVRYEEQHPGWDCSVDRALGDAYNLRLGEESAIGVDEVEGVVDSVRGSEGSLDFLPPAGERRYEFWSVSCRDLVNPDASPLVGFGVLHVQDTSGPEVSIDALDVHTELTAHPDRIGAGMIVFVDPQQPIDQWEVAIGFCNNLGAVCTSTFYASYALMLVTAHGDDAAFFGDLADCEAGALPEDKSCEACQLVFTMALEED